jgi:23S rRNA (cytosine1962-C5)-methyltransferase
MNAKIYLKKNEERRIKTGHLWVFSNEIDHLEGEAHNGELIELYDSKKNFIGSGFYNKNSLIAVRILSNKKIDDLKELFRKRINKAFDLRKSMYPERNSFRLVFSESDFLPGLIIDKYNNTFVLQVYSYGMEKNIGLIVEVLKDDLAAENIFTKNEEYFRKLEGLPIEDKIYLGEMKSEIINDGAVEFNIDFSKGHKTGFYFDQSDNRFFIERFVKGKKVLDAFCYSGGFGLHAARAGASSITLVDSSSKAIENAKQNFKLNELPAESEFIVSDVFDFFETCIREKKYFDVVMIDPPAFAKNRKSVPVAKKGYTKLNRLALQIVSENGFLVTSSCSHHISGDIFMEIVNQSALKAGRKIKQIYFNGASLDHPRLPAMPETGYLKFGIFTVSV